MTEMVLAESENVSPGNTFRELAMRNEVSATGIAKVNAQFLSMQETR